MSHFKNNRKNNRRNNNNEKYDNVCENDPIIASFRQYSQELDEKHDRYERIVKHSRDITIESKRIIFLLHTVDAKKPNFEKILSDAAERLLVLCKSHFASIANELAGIDPYQFVRAYSAGLQEFIEAYTYHEYVSGEKLSDWETLQAKLTYEHKDIETEKQVEEDVSSANLPTERKTDVEAKVSQCLVQPVEFMLGVGDLSGEVMRRCVNSLGSGDFDTCFLACKFLQQLYCGFMSLGQVRNKEFSYKLYTLGQSVLKVENVCYNIKVRGGEAAKWGSSRDESSLMDKHSLDIDEGFF